MSDSSMKIYEISDKLGFESSFYFSKVFKKKEGVSPKEYINQKMD
jgi:two-component system, response regulator YesN